MRGRRYYSTYVYNTHDIPVEDLVWSSTKVVTWVLILSTQDSGRGFALANEASGDEQANSRSRRCRLPNFEADMGLKKYTAGAADACNEPLITLL